MKTRQPTALLLFLTAAAHAQAPQFAIDPGWPQPLPERWITGRLGGVCVDGHDHVIVTNRRDITAEETETSLQAPSVLIFDGSPDGKPRNSSRTFDRTGKFLRPWGRQATPQETRDGAPAAFAEVVHCIAMSAAGLLYVCDRQGDRIQIFDKLGRFQRNLWIRTGTAWAVDFSRDAAQRYLFVMNGRNEQVHVVERDSGRIFGSFGRPDHQLGNFTHGHALAVDSKGNLYVAETDTGRRIQKFTLSR